MGCMANGFIRRIGKVTEEVPQRCGRCDGPIQDGDLALRQHGDWYHLQCAVSIKPDTASEEPPAVLCVICRTGIRTIHEMAPMNGVGPMHVHCQADSRKDSGS